jgi:hypothetical protein
MQGCNWWSFWLKFQRCLYAILLVSGFDHFHLIHLIERVVIQFREMEKNPSWCKTYIFSVENRLIGIELVYEQSYLYPETVNHQDKTFIYVMYHSAFRLVGTETIFFGHYKLLNKTNYCQHLSSFLHIIPASCILIITDCPLLQLS